ncbi:MAG: hypothetical protein IT204_20860 [Fimbriimonadaceae bacterium]|nr:hypothetical protein [Fimbriimonadaceae bacterium]
MTWRVKAWLAGIALLAVLGGMSYRQMQLVDRFDEGFSLLLTESNGMLGKAAADRSQLPAFFDWFAGEAKQRLTALPDSGQQFQQILRLRLGGLIDKATAQYKSNPLQASSMEFMTAIAQELNDMLLASQAGKGFAGNGF